MKAQELADLLLKVPTADVILAAPGRNIELGQGVTLRIEPAPIRPMEMVDIAMNNEANAWIIQMLR